MIVPTEVLAAVAEHARAIDAERPGHESLGVLVYDGDRVERYTKLMNGARRPNRVRLAHASQLTRRGAQGRLLVLHSHPVSPATPSEDDLRWAAWNEWNVLAIFSVPHDELRVWRLDGDNVIEMPLVIEA